MEHNIQFESILRLLHGHGIKFVLIGGLAMQARGSSHLTRDVDVLYAREHKNLNLLVDTLNLVHPTLRGAPPDLPFHLDARTLSNTFNLTLVTDLGDLDLIGEIQGSSFSEIWEGADTMELYDLPIRVASLDDLIHMKKVAGRPKDLVHIMELEALKKLLGEGGSSLG